MIEREVKISDCSRNLFSVFGVFVLTLSYPIFSLLWRHQYSFVSIDVVFLFSLIVLLAMILAFLVRVVNIRMGNVMLAIMILLAFVVQFDLLFEHLALWFPAMFILSLMNRKNFVQLALVVLTALLIGSFIDAKVDQSSRLNLKPVSSVEKSKPIVVHVLLDEFIGPDGFPPQDISQKLRADVLAFFLENGFEVYSRAYSHYHATQDSLSHAFQLENGATSSAQLAAIFNTSLSIHENRYFEIMRNQGYSLNIYQTDMVDFCSAIPSAVNRCRVFITPNLNTVASDVHNVWSRIGILVAVLFQQSKLFKQSLFDSQLLNPWGVSLYQPAVIDEMLSDLKEGGASMYFAHILLPHSPYVYREDCQLDYSSEPWERSPISGSDSANSEGSRAMRYLRYIPQVRCALSELQRLFNGMHRLGIYDQAKIIVHSDHGSRISLHDAIVANADLLTPEDYRDLFSTLFAIRTPTGKSRENNEVVSLNILMTRALKLITDTDEFDLDGVATAEESPFIYLSRRIPLVKKEINIFEDN